MTINKGDIVAINLSISDSRLLHDHEVPGTEEFSVGVDVVGPPSIPGVVGTVIVKRNMHGVFPDLEHIRFLLPGADWGRERRLLVTRLKDLIRAEPPVEE